MMISNIDVNGVNLKYEFIKITNDTILIEGSIQYVKRYSFALSFFVNERITKVDTYKKCKDIVIDGYNEFYFYLSIKNEHNQKIQIKPVFDNAEICRVEFGDFFPLSTTYNNCYCAIGNRIIAKKNNALIIECGNDINKYELKYCKELWNALYPGSRKAIFVRLFCRILKQIKKHQIWLISDRVNMADDNGEAFFRYVSKRNKTINSYFVIKEDCESYKRVKQYRNILKYGKWKHKILFLICDYNISSQISPFIQNVFYGHSDPYKDFLYNIKFIFLQHGISMNDVSGWLARRKKNIYGFTVTSEKEKNNILKTCDYVEKQIWLTGFARYDLLYEDKKKIITIMPTWREYLTEYDYNNMTVVLKKGFKNSTFYNFYSNLLNNAHLIDEAKKHGYEIVFYPHPTFRNMSLDLVRNSYVQESASKETYKKILAESSLIVTDYSSAAMDFSYLYKPVIYAQFDEKEMFSGKHVYTKGDFDYKKDGFGEVEYTLDGTITRIIEYMKIGCELKEKYRKRIDDYYAYNDKKNSERIYKKLISGGY